MNITHLIYASLSCHHTISISIRKNARWLEKAYAFSIFFSKNVKMLKEIGEKCHFILSRWFFIEREQVSVHTLVFPFFPLSPDCLCDDQNCFLDSTRVSVFSSLSLSRKLLQENFFHPFPNWTKKSLVHFPLNTYRKFPHNPRP